MTSDAAIGKAAHAAPEETLWEAWFADVWDESYEQGWQMGTYALRHALRRRPGFDSAGSGQRPAEGTNP